jgi:hypothetical protein
MVKVYGVDLSTERRAIEQHFELTNRELEEDSPGQT